MAVAWFLAVALASAVLLLACTQERSERSAAATAASAEPTREDAFRARRAAMIERDLVARDVRDEAVLAAMARVQRHAFVPVELADQAYEDHPLPIGHGQTISQPYIVAKMTELARVAPGRRVLEIGTGSGYQAAVLAELGAEVYTIEIVEDLGRQAQQTLQSLGYDRVHCRVGDGYAGWPEAAPFDAILLTAAPPRIPQPLIDQLKDGGRLVAPVGTRSQDLRVVTKRGGEVTEESIFAVRFVPMTGRAQEDK